MLPSLPPSGDEIYLGVSESEYLSYLSPSVGRSVGRIQGFFKVAIPYLRLVARYLTPYVAFGSVFTYHETNALPHVTGLFLWDCFVTITKQNSGTNYALLLRQNKINILASVIVYKVNKSLDNIKA